MSMKIVNLKAPAYRYMMDALNSVIYDTQHESGERGERRFRASLKMTFDTETGDCEWAVAADDGGGNMVTRQRGATGGGK